MKLNQQFIVLIFVIAFAFVGSSMPYIIFAPLFLHPKFSGLVSVHESLSLRSIYLGFVLAVYPLGQFIGSPILGALSDQYGRKRLLLYSMLGTAICYFISALSINYSVIWLLILSRFIAGTLEGNLAIAQACVADLPINKHKGFGAVNATASIGYIIGPLLAGVLSNNNIISWFNLSTPFYVASFIAIFTAISIALCLQESNDVTHVVKTSILSQFNIVNRFIELSKNKDLTILFIGGFFMFLAIDTYFEFFPAFLVQQWHMSTTEIAMLNAILCVGLTIGCLVTPIYLSKKYSTIVNLRMMIMIYPVIFLCILITTHNLLLYFQFALIGLAYGAANTFQTVLISENAREDQQGEVMGFRWGLRMLGDGLICIIGGFAIIHSIYIPLIIAFMLGSLSLIFFFKLSAMQIASVRA